jgi:large subunit ribosomal protein L25
MANIIDLTADTRTVKGSSSAGRLRRAGTIPAVLYGRKRENQELQIDSKTFTHIINHSASDNILVNLKLGAGEQLALVQEVQHDHLRGGVLHVDFHAIAMDEEIHAEVPVETKGEAIGIKAGGQLELLVHKLSVHCLPKDLPERLVIDVTGLGVGQAIHVRELVLPVGVRVKLDGDVVVVMVEESKVVAEEPAAAADTKAPAKGATKAAAKTAAPAAKAAAKK